jgi:hypothetical protein
VPAAAVGKVVLKLPPATAWSSRTQTLSVLGSPDDGAFSTLAGSKAYTFDPATGNTGWPAGQISEFEVYAS